MTHLLASEGGYQGFVLTSTEKWWLVVVLVAAVFGLAVGVLLTRGVLRADTGTPKMREIASAIQEGAVAFLRRQFRAIGIIIVPLAVLIFFTATKVVRPGGSVALSFGAAGGFRVLCFLFGAACSGLTGFIGMSLAVRGNVRTAAAARGGELPGALKVAFRTGAVTGLLCVGLGLLGATVIVFAFQNTATAVLVGFGFGASLLALFMRVGGGIFTKAADVGADLVGKVEAGIPEDDPRNAATIADNVGDNVGDCAGMAADLFETYAVTTVATMVLAAIFFRGQDIVSNMMLLPLGICGVCIVTSIIGAFAVRLGKNNNIMGALYQGLIVTGVLSVGAIWFVINKLVPADGIDVPTLVEGTTKHVSTMELFGCGMVGLAVTAAIVVITEYYTGTNFRPVKSVDRKSVV